MTCAVALRLKISDHVLKTVMSSLFQSSSIFGFTAKVSEVACLLAVMVY